jgi:hypothetical protein
VHDQFVANGEDIAGYIKFAGMVKNNPKDYSKLCSKVKEATNDENKPFTIVSISPNQPLVGKENEDVGDYLNLLVSHYSSPPLQNPLLEQVKQSQSPQKSDKHDLCNLTIQHILKYNLFKRSSEDEPLKCKTCHGLVGLHKKQIERKIRQNWSKDEEDAFFTIFINIGKPVDGNEYTQYPTWGKYLQNRTKIQIKEKYKSLKKQNRIN